MHAKTLNNFLIGLLLFSVSCHAADRRIQISTHYALVEITDRLVRPWGMAFLDDEHVLISEKEGGLVIVDLNNRSKTPLQGLPEDLDTRNRQFGDNAGLFGVALDPNFTQNQRVFVAYSAANSASDTTTKVISASLKEHRLTDVQTVFIAEPYSSIRFHYGGGLLTTPDNKLYFTVGERYFDERNQPALPVAQDDSDKRGKIYRVDLNASVLKAKQFAKGIRAAQGLALDSVTKTILFSEHGTRQGDEINALVPNGNYGWPIITTGKYRSEEYTPPKIEDDFVAPLWAWPNTVAPTGLTIYRRDTLPTLQNKLLVAGLSKGSLWAFELKPRARGSLAIGDGVELMIKNRMRLRSVVTGPNGRVFVLTDEANGRLLQLVELSDIH